MLLPLPKQGCHYLEKWGKCLWKLHVFICSSIQEMRQVALYHISISFCWQNSSVMRHLNRSSPTQPPEGPGDPRDGRERGANHLMDLSLIFSPGEDNHSYLTGLVQGVSKDRAWIWSVNYKARTLYCYSFHTIEGKDCLFLLGFPETVKHTVGIQ